MRAGAANDRRIFFGSTMGKPHSTVMEGRTCVITGATSGIGRSVAIALAGQGASLILVGRNAKRGNALASRLGRGRKAGLAEFHRCDLTLRGEVENLAQLIRKRFATIDVLVNNAGARFDSYATNPDGVERTFAGNHLGHFLLTSLLLEPLLQSRESRVIVVGSGAHSVTPPPGWILSEENYDRKLAYGSSKLANIVFSYELSRRLDGTTVTVNAVDPGGVATRLGLNNGFAAWLKHIAYYLSKRQLLSAGRAAASLVELCVAPEFKGKTGGYYSAGRLIRSSALSYDTELGHELWALSVQRAGLDSARLGALWKYFAP